MIHAEKKSGKQRLHKIKCYLGLSEASGSNFR